MTAVIAIGDDEMDRTDKIAREADDFLRELILAGRVMTMTEMIATDQWTWDKVREAMGKALDGPPAPPAPPAAPDPAPDISERDKAVHRALGALGKAGGNLRMGYAARD